MKIYNELLSQGKYILEKIYIGKKKANLVTPIEKKKNQKTRNWLVKRKKPPFGLVSYNAKSAQY